MKNRTANPLIFLIPLLFYLIVLIVFGTATFADSMRGFEIISQSKNTAEFNSLVYPIDLIKDKTYYVAWWSPGQWILPYLLMQLLNIQSVQIIQGILIVSLLSISIIGYMKLFKVLNFSAPTITFALFLIVTNQLFYWHTLMYYGGDLLLIAVFPYFLIFLIKNDEFHVITKVLIFTLICLAGCLSKNTFVLIIVCGLVFLFNTKQGNFLERIKSSFLLSVISLIILSLFYYFHLSNGETPAGATDLEGYNGIPNTLFGDLTYSFGSALGSITRMTFIIQKAIGISSWITYLQILPVIATFFFIIHLWTKPSSTYQKLIIFFGIPYMCLFCLMYLKNQSVSYEMRHFAPITFIFIPGFIDWIKSFRWKKIAVFLMVAVSFLDLGWYAYSANKLYTDHGFWQSYLVSKTDLTAMTKIEKWDNAEQKGLVIIEDYWALSMAVKKNKKLVLQKSNGSWKVVTGIELNAPDYCDFNPSFTKIYKRILLVVNKKSHLTDEFRNYNPVLIEQTEAYNFFQIDLIN